MTEVIFVSTKRNSSIGYLQQGTSVPYEKPYFNALVEKVLGKKSSEYEAGATRKELARKYDILPHYINRWQLRVQKVTQSINEETKRYKAQIIEKHQKEIDKKVEEQNIQQELHALKTRHLKHC